MSRYVWLHHGMEEEISPGEQERLCREQKKAVCMAAPELKAECPDHTKSQTLSVIQLLCDERYVENGLVIEENLLRQAGGKNNGLSEKQEYELALRIAHTEPLYLNFDEQAAGYAAQSLVASRTTSEEKYLRNGIMGGFFTDAYVTGRYFTLLKECGMADAVLEALLAACEDQPDPAVAQRFLEEMLSHTGVFYQLYRATQPILIYLGPTYCYNILRVFAEELGRSFGRLGQSVEYFDTEAKGTEGIGCLLGKQYKASIGFQTWLLSVKHDDGHQMTQDLIGGPKYNFIVDHPVWLESQLRETPADYHVLTHDRNYMKFIRRYFPQISGVHLLPPGGGRSAAGGADQEERPLGIIFLGTYRDYRDGLSDIQALSRKERFLAVHYLAVMRRQTALTPEEAFEVMLRRDDSCLSDTAFLQLFSRMKFVIQIVMYYYRENVIRTILDSGFQIHVYGNTWQKSPFADHPGFIIHPEVAAEESMEVLRKAKISLNIMAWHKDGFTERIADSMLAGAVVLSDYSTQLAEFYGDETVLFDLNHLEALKEILAELLEEEEKREQIARRAKKKADDHATWEKRAEQLLRMIEGESGL